MFGQSERRTLRASTRTVTGGSVSELIAGEI
jgi:hypothetical protein